MKINYTNTSDVFSFNSDSTKAYKLGQKRMTSKLQCKIEEAINFDGYKYLSNLTTGSHVFRIDKMSDGELVIMHHFTVGNELEVTFVDFKGIDIDEEELRRLNA